MSGRWRKLVRGSSAVVTQLFARYTPPLVLACFKRLRHCAWKGAANNDLDRAMLPRSTPFPRKQAHSSAFLDLRCWSVSVEEAEEAGSLTGIAYKRQPQHLFPGPECAEVADGVSDGAGNERARQDRRREQHVGKRLLFIPEEEDGGVPSLGL